jgi:hypothetical protein
MASIKQTPPTLQIASKAALTVIRLNVTLRNIGNSYRTGKHFKTIGINLTSLNAKYCTTWQDHSKSHEIGPMKFFRPPTKRSKAELVSPRAGSCRSAQKESINIETQNRARWERCIHWSSQKLWMESSIAPGILMTSGNIWSEWWSLTTKCKSII